MSSAAKWVGYQVKMMKQRGYLGTYSEFAEAFKISSSCAYHHKKNAIRRGLIELRPEHGCGAFYAKKAKLLCIPRSRYRAKQKPPPVRLKPYEWSQGVFTDDPRIKPSRRAVNA